MKRRNSYLGARNEQEDLKNLFITINLIQLVLLKSSRKNSEISHHNLLSKIKQTKKGYSAVPVLEMPLPVSKSLIA